MSGLWWCLLAFDETFYVLSVRRFLLPVRGVILNPLVRRFSSPFTPCPCGHGVACFDGLACFAKAVLEADSQNIRISSFGISVTKVVGFGWVDGFEVELTGVVYCCVIFVYSPLIYSLNICRVWHVAVLRVLLEG